MRRLGWSSIVVLATLGGLLLLWQFRLALGLFTISLFVAAVARPAVEVLKTRGLPRGLAILLTYFFGLVFLVGLFILIGGPFLRELSQLTNSFTTEYELVTRTWPGGTGFQRAVAAQLPEPEMLYQAISGEQGAMLLRGFLGVAQGFFGTVAQLFLIIAVSIYWSLDRARFERLWLTVLPAKFRTRALEVWRAIENGVAEYFRSEVFQSLWAGLLLGLGYWAMGVNYPVILALAGALLRLIPWLGALLVVLLSAAVGMGGGPGLAFMAAGYSILIFLFLELLVEPRFFQRQRYSPLLIVIVMVAMAEAFGLVGLVIAPPLAASIQTLFRNLSRLSAPAETTNPSVQIAGLEKRLARVREVADKEGENLPPGLASVVERLESLIEETRQFFHVEQEAQASLELPTKEESAI